MRLKSVVRQTPVLTSRTLDTLADQVVYMKGEHLQRTGSFKIRGAYNVISELPSDVRRRGVVAYSTGNHGLGVAWTASQFGIPCHLVIPSDAPSTKVAAAEDYGANVHLYDRHKEDRVVLATELADQHGLTLIPPYDHPAVIAAGGTVMWELLHQQPDLDAVLVPVGGGGLIAGCALAAHVLKPDLKVIGVEPVGNNDTQQSLAQGRRVIIDPELTIADGLWLATPGALTFPIIQQYVHGVVSVSEEEIRSAVDFMLYRGKQVVEPSGAVGVAAVLTQKVPSYDNVGIILTGGNMSSIGSRNVN